MEPFLFENVGQILNCILYCITVFKVEKNALKKIKNCLKLPLGGGGSQNFSKVWGYASNLRKVQEIS